MPKKHKAAKPPTELEHKTIATGASSAVVGVLVAVAYAVEGDPSTIGWLPVWAQTLILAGLVALVPTAAAYRAPHTTRSDVPKTAMGTAGADPVRTATVKVVADTSGFVAAIEAAKAHVEQLTEAVPVPAPFTGDTPSPYTGGDVVQDPDAPAAVHRTPRKRTAKKAVQS